ncbi:hypothetical protein LTR93_011776 [Exophiala xenobiotica]|nr:hypothetical protein LTR93_011776 [Exophiala xenobiotica]
MKLYDILIEITSQFYATTDTGDTTKTTKFSSPKDPRYRFVVEIEHTLNLFWNSLPTFLNSAKRDAEQPATEARSIFQHQSRVLQIVVYAAATIVVAARVCPPILLKVEETDLDRTWRQAMHVLEQYENLNISADPARRCLAALTLLNDKTTAFRGRSTRQGSQQPIATRPTSTADMVALDPGLEYPIDMFTFEDPTALDGIMDWEWDWVNTGLSDFDVQTAFP